jgi:hypothetical protein
MKSENKTHRSTVDSVELAPWRTRPTTVPLICTRERPIDPRAGLNRWQRLVYLLRIIFWKEAPQERFGRWYWNQLND